MSTSLYRASVFVRRAGAVRRGQTGGGKDASKSSFRVVGGLGWESRGPGGPAEAAPRKRENLAIGPSRG